MSDTTDALPHVSRTAIWVAAMRAVENARPDRLFDDRFAAAFVAAALPEGTTTEAPPGSSEFLAIRIRHYDDFLAEACAAGIRQVVQLAAGLDSRAFRLPWPAGVRLFELDLPELFAFKEPVLDGHTPGCARSTVPVDLRADWATPLTAAGFDPSAPVAWVAEGLLIYLTPTDNDRLMTTVRDLSAPGSRLAFDHMDDSAVDRKAMRDTTDAVRQMGVSLLSTLEDPLGWPESFGWHAEVSRVPELGVRYGRPLPEFVDLTACNATLLVTAQG